MKLKRIILVSLVLSIIMITFACKKQSPTWKGTIEEKDGVMVVKNPKEPIYSEDVFSLEEELTIGETTKEKEPEFLVVSSLRVDNDENIYVLDRKACQITVFDKNGKHLSNIGRKGQGPGEMQAPTIMEIFSEKEIMISDLINNRISFFSLEGKLLKEVSKGKFFRLINPLPDSNRNFIGSIRVQIEEKRIDELIKFNPNFEPIFTIKKLEYIDEPNVIYPFPPMLFYIMLEENKVLWGNWLNYSLQIVDAEGKARKEIHKAYDPVKTTDEDKKQDIKERFGGEGIPPGIKLVFPEHFPAFWHLSTDDEGRIFVQTFERTDEGSFYYDVFDSEGKYMAKITLRTRPRAWKNNKLYTIEEDEEGYQYVKRYKVKWNI